MLASFLIGLGLVLAQPALAQGPPAGAFVEAYLDSIEGQVTVVHPGASAPARPGDAINAGDTVRTGSDGSARLVYADESLQLLSRNTTLRVLQHVSGPDHAPRPVSELSQGTVETRVIPAPTPSGHKFFLRTPDVVLGVRGTQFVVDSAPGSGAEVHTLEGSVELAPDFERLRSGKGIVVPTDRMAQARRGGISAPAPFDHAAYVRKFRADHPGAARILGRPARRFQEHHRARLGRQQQQERLVRKQREAPARRRRRR